MWKKFGVIATAACVVCIMAVNFITAQTKPGARGQIGVINIVAVMNNYNRTKDLNSGLETRQNTIKAEYQKRFAKLKAAEEERNQFNIDSPDYIRRDSEVKKAAFDLRAWRDLQTALMEDRHRRLTEEIYGKITKAAAKYAKANGYSIILRLDEIDMKSATSQQLLEKIRIKTIIYSNKSIHITKPLLKQLNGAYHAKASK